MGDEREYSLPKVDPTALAEHVTVSDAGVVNVEATEELRARLRARGMSERIENSTVEYAGDDHIVERLPRFLGRMAGSK